MNCCYMERIYGVADDASRQQETSSPGSLKIELNRNTRYIIDQLRKSPELKDITEADAIEISEALYMLSVIMYELYSQEKS